MSDLSSPTPPTNPSQRPVTPAPVTSGDSTAQGQTNPRHSEGQSLPPEQHPPPNPAVTLSPSLAGMSPGQTVEAVVLGADADGVPVIRAAGGTFLAVTQDAPPPHAELILKIQSTGHEINAFVTSVNGKAQHPPSEIRLLLTNLSGGTTGGPMTPPLATYSPPISGARPLDQIPKHAQPLAPGLQLTAQVVPAPLAAAALLSGDLAAGTPNEPATTASPIRIGTPLLVRIISVGGTTVAAVAGAPGKTPAASTATAPQAPTSQGAKVAPAATTAAATQTPVAGAQPAQPQSQGREPPQTGSAAPSASHTNQTQSAAASAQPVESNQSHLTGPQAAPNESGHTVASPAAAATSSPAVAGAPPSPAQATTLRGVVLEQTAEGQTLVQTPAGVLQFGAALVAEPGLEVTLEALPTSAPTSSNAAAATAPTSPQAALADFSSGWSALRELVQVVQATDPGVAQQFVTQRVPGLNARATSNILFFVSALRGGDMQGWLGADMTRAAERAGHRRLLDRLGDDFLQLRTLIDADKEAEWRAAPFPFFDGKEIEPVNMFVRGRRPGGEDGEEDVRFVVQLELSELGAMQLDGLFQKQNFDLIVRNHDGLSEKVRQGISTLFNDAIEATGLKGNIVFQNVERFPVSPFSDLFGVEHPAGNVVA